MRIHIVYCPRVGYCPGNDTGKRFRLESEAEHFAMRLRKAGHLAWTEATGADHFDA